jgi:hypothetical protein
VIVLSTAQGTAIAATPGWRTVAVTARQDVFLSVAAGDGRHAWAAGLTPASHQISRPALYQWNGSSWKPAVLPAKIQSLFDPDGFLFPVVAAAPDNFWGFTVSQAWIHEDGSSWTAGPMPFSYPVTAATIAGGKYVWAFGLTGNGRNVIADYAADTSGPTVRWTRTVVPDDVPIGAVSALSGGDLWAVNGSPFTVSGPADRDGPRTPAPAAPGAIALWHYFAGKWHKTAPIPPVMRKAPFLTVFAHSDKNVLVGGAVRNSRKGTTEAVASWDGHGWTVRKLSAPVSRAEFSVSSLAGDGAGGLWALATCLQACPKAGVRFRLWHERGGKWTGPVEPRLAGHQVELSGLALAGPSVWAVGDVRLGKNDTRGLIARWGS